MAVSVVSSLNSWVFGLLHWGVVGWSAAGLEAQPLPAIPHKRYD